MPANARSAGSTNSSRTDKPTGPNPARPGSARPRGPRPQRPRREQEAHRAGPGGGRHEQDDPGRESGEAMTYEEDRAVNSAAREVRVVVVGVGNCAASLVQGVHYYA